MKRFIVIFYLFLCIPAWLWAQGVGVKASIEAQQIQIGQPVKFRLEVTQPAAFTVVFPNFDSLQSGVQAIATDVELMDKPVYDTTPTNGDYIIVSQHSTVQAFNVGSITIPSFAFVVSNTRDTLYTDSLVIEVTPVSLDTSAYARIDTTMEHKVFPEKNPATADFSLAELWYYIKKFITDYWWALLLLAALIGGLIYYFYKRKQKPVVVIEKPKVPAHVQALDELDKLKNKQLWQQDKVKDYHSELTEIVRRYIEERYQVPALESTSDEVLQSLRASISGTDSYDKLRQILTLADFVKFAKMQPLATEHDMSLRNAYDFVLATKPHINETQQQMTATSVTEKQPISNVSPTATRAIENVKDATKNPVLGTKPHKKIQIKKLVKILTPIALLILGIVFTMDYFDNSSKKRAVDLELLIANGSETVGMLENKYIERTIKIAQISAKAYEYSYTFKVGEETYSGNKTLNKPATNPLVKVKYLDDDPSINAINPEEDLASLKDTDNTGLLVGLGFLILGLISGFFRLKALRKPD